MRLMAALAGARRDPICCEYASRAGTRADGLRSGTAHCRRSGMDPFALVDAAVAEAARLSGNHSVVVHALQ